MTSNAYRQRLDEIEVYFDDTAVEAWKRLTSTEPVSGIRATVRAGRDRMRALIAQCLPDDLGGRRILDAGCGTGAMAVELARRGADVVAIDIAKNLVDMARERTPADLGAGRIEFRVGDMLGAAREGFDHVVAMDSLIHYAAPDMVAMVEALAEPTRGSLLFTYPPRTTATALMHMTGRLFPRADRAPSIEPIGPADLGRRLARSPQLGTWRAGRCERVVSGFYLSEMLELVRR
ncbi:MAG: magnesium protoporphyrin IX methyltransferase [Hyphomicrobiaceae bacterium]|nr:magnesium protoporphyrin IX methyltransferase [Hyphomicrobiaceae bacterium]